MKKRTKIKIFIDRIFNKFIKVDNIEKIEEGLSRQKEASKKLNKSYYEAQGALESYQEELKKNQENKEKLNKCFEICKKKDDKEGAKQIYNEINSTNLRIKTLEEQVQKQELIVARFKQAKERYEKEIRDLKNNLETMKSKNRFSKSVKEYEEQFGEFEEFDIEDIKKDIDIEFNASNAQLAENDNNLDLDKIESESNFEEMWGK